MNSEGGNWTEWIEPLTKRGRWGRRSASDKSLVEVDAVRDVVPAFAAEFGLTLGDVRPGNDPPDVVASMNGRELNIEVCELLNRQVREKRARGLTISHEEQLWTEEQFFRGVNDLVGKKDRRYQSRAGFEVDILLIVSCELWLYPEQAKQWLSVRHGTRTRCIRSAYFAQEQLPDYPKPHWPLFRIF